MSFNENHLALACEGISKRYLLGERSNVYRITEQLSSFLKFNKQKPVERKSFWALKNISFELKKESITAIIGRNGAGKSTLLKVLSQITSPTEGRFGYNGHLASLLEVGTGFKQELTGRDNIFLSGTIMGLSRSKIRSLFDEIVAFAEVEEFIDTPVKRYSSGMYLRLAFAVAAHLDSDILLIDEVLAVGDQKFQKKCLQKMSSSAKEGRTVIFVSHNMQAVTQICNQALLLHSGEMQAFGAVKEVAQHYEKLNKNNDKINSELRFDKKTDSDASFSYIVMGSENAVQSSFDVMEDISFEIHYEVNQPVDDLKVVAHLRTIDGQIIIVSSHLDTENAFLKNKRLICEHNKGEYVWKGNIEAPLLNQGLYEITFFLSATHIEIFDTSPVFEIEVTDLKGSFVTCINQSPSPALITPLVKWKNLK